jgi:hypothetical protein
MTCFAKSVHIQCVVVLKGYEETARQEFFLVVAADCFARRGLIYHFLKTCGAFTWCILMLSSSGAEKREVLNESHIYKNFFNKEDFLYFEVFLFTDCFFFPAVFFSEALSTLKPWVFKARFLASSRLMTL